jgi:hypothetical protein
MAVCGRGGWPARPCTSGNSDRLISMFSMIPYTLGEDFE